MCCRFDYIGKFEELQEDAAEILLRIRGSRAVDFPNYKYSNTRDSFNMYMDQITPDLKDQLQILYTKDIDAFGYDRILI